MFITNVIRLGMLLALMGWFLSTFDLMGAVMITLAGMFLSKIMALYRIRQVLHTTYSELLPWKSLVTTLVAAAVAALPGAILISTLDVPTLVLLPVTGMIYAVSYAALVLIWSLLSDEEVEAVKKTLFLWNRRRSIQNA
jgi:hypothetical protein